MHTVAIIASAGKGKRVADRIPKQFIRVDGRPLICHTLSVFDSISCIDGIILVAAPDRVEYCKKLARQYNLKKILEIVPGSSTRAGSVYNGLKVTPPGTKVVVVHDGVRPLVSGELIRRAINGAQLYGAAITAAVPKSTIKEVNRNWIKRNLSRSKLAEIQTPQAFRYSVLRDSYKRYRGRLKDATDTSFIVEQAGYRVRVINGDYRNIKVTTRDDLEFVRSLLRPEHKRVGIGYDIHRLVKGRRLILGGVRIPARAGLLGHSDADVLLHALTDAILGAIGERDIGWHFPDTDIRYKGTESKYFLFKAKELMQGRRYKVLNVDSIVVAQSPLLQPYYKAMVGNISKWLRLPRDRITVKFCTPEELGPLGHRKAIAAMAVAALGR